MVYYSRCIFYSFFPSSSTSPIPRRLWRTMSWWSMKTKRPPGTPGLLVKMTLTVPSTWCATPDRTAVPSAWITRTVLHAWKMTVHTMGKVFVCTEIIVVLWITVNIYINLSLTTVSLEVWKYTIINLKTLTHNLEEEGIGDFRRSFYSQHFHN